MQIEKRSLIFVVEDNLIYQQLIAKELETGDWDIHFYTNGESCLPNLHMDPAIIIMDYNLDGEINGLDTIYEVRLINEKVPIILFSSLKGLRTKANLSKYGRFDYLQKSNKSLPLLKQMVTSKEIR